MVGTFAFGGILAMTFFNESMVERAAESFLISQVERELGVRFGIDTAGPFVDSVVGSLPGTAKELTVTRAERLREVIRSRGASGQSGAEMEVAPDSPEITEDHRTVAVGYGAYRRLLGDLLREIRVFAGCNCALFASAALLAGWRREDTPYLILPAGILASATCLAVGSYLIAENWFWAFLTSSYFGYWYLLLVGAAAALLADIAFNRARVTSMIARVLWHRPA